MRRLAISTILLIALLCSCEKEENQAPKIVSVTLNPDEVDFGDSVQISCIATDEEGDRIDYTWYADHGEVAEVNAQSTTWKIPNSLEFGRNLTLRITVSDGKEFSSLTSTITINRGTQISGFIYHANTQIPITGVTVEVGEFTAYSDSSGYFELENVTNGIAQIELSKLGYETLIQEIDLSSSSQFNFNLFSNTLDNKIYGQLQTIDGIVLPGLEVILLNPDGSPSGISAKSDVLGNFQILAVPTGSRTIRIENIDSTQEIKAPDYELYVTNSDYYFNPRVYILRDDPLDILNPNNLQISGECELQSDRLLVKSSGSILFNMSSDFPEDILPYSETQFFRVEVDGSSNQSGFYMQVYHDYEYINLWWSNLPSYNGTLNLTLTEPAAPLGKTLGFKWGINSSSQTASWSINELRLLYYY